MLMVKFFNIRITSLAIADGTGSPFDIDDLGEVNGINADGSMLTGVYNGEAYYWTEATGFVPIGTLTPSPAVRAMGVGIAGDGTIVGFDINQFPTEAWLWTEEGGLESLRGKLVELGLTDLPTLQVGMDISLDGRTIIGHTFFTGAWIVTLPGEPCPADIDGDGDVGFSDLLAVITAWGPCPGCPEDLDGNNAVEFADLLVVLTEWGRCP